ncbi:hemagglutinin repeat-containing protein [Hylemonella gracilis]|uniref:hemagglutinin repeat-containing protein n=1 Tax=Hylemonella gracilis TaxID=80880 RepID=UPI000B190EF4|nr:hemagglutinin repeat-containing protein [Hylemonella gracilis]
MLAAQNNVTLIGADVSTEGTAVLSGKNVTLEAAAETSTSETSHSEHTVGGLGSKLNKDEVSLGGMKEVKTTETTTTTSTTHKGTTLNVGNLAVLATQDVNIVASKVEVEGQAIVQAGGDVNVTGKQDTTSTEKRTEVETTTTAVAVRNAYVDTALAVKALKDAFDAAKDAKDAYEDAKKRVDSGELAKAALKDYEINMVAAAANLVQAEISAAASIAGAATAASQSMGTGFYVSGSAQKEVTTTSTTQTASTWQGSSIDAGGLVISGKNTTIEGSDITAGWLKLDSDKVLITAGIDQYKNETSSSTKSVTASGGSNGSASASASTSSSQSSSTSLQNVNSRINVGHLESDADSFTLRGAEVTAKTADLNVGSLTVQSLQDTSSSSNSSKSTSVGVSNSTSSKGSSQSANVGVNRSSGSSEAQEVGSQTQLLITDGANSQITAKDTTLIGGLIANATQNKDGTLTDHGKLNLTTGTLTVSDLEDKSESEQSGWGFQTSSGRSADAKGNNVSYGGSGSTTVSMSNEGHKKEGETQATLGLGNIKVGGADLSGQEQYASLNRNVNEAQITTLDQQTGGLNAGVTMDNRWLTSAGRDSLLNDQKNLGKNSAMAAAGAVADVARVGAAATSLATDPDQVLNAWNTVGKGQELAYANEGKLAGETENLRDGLTKDAQTAQDSTNGIDKFINGGDGSRVKMTDGTWAYGAVDESGKTIYVDMEGNRLKSVVNTVAHEGMHVKGAGEATATVTGYMTDLAYRANAWANSEQIDANRPAPVTTNSAASQQLLINNKAAFLDQAERGELEYRQLHSTEAELIRENAAKYAAQRGGISTDQAIAELTKQSLRQVDSAWAERITENPQAAAFLKQTAQGAGPKNVGGGTLFDARGTSAFNDHTTNAASLPQTADLYSHISSRNVTGIVPNVSGAYVAYNDAAHDANLVNATPQQVQQLLNAGQGLKNQVGTAQEVLAVSSANLGIAQTVYTSGNATPGDGSQLGNRVLGAMGEAAMTGLPNEGGSVTTPTRGMGAAAGQALPTTTGSRTSAGTEGTGLTGGTTAGGAANSVTGARLNMQLSAEQAAGARAPTTITSYSAHAVSQINGRDGGIGVSQSAINDAFANPVGIQYVPSKYGPTFRYIGQNATVVVNSEGNVVTNWATSSAGTRK